MAFLLMNDSTPFAEEYDTNYYYFDANDPKAFREAVRLLANKSHAQKNTPVTNNVKRGSINL
ncbi:MAG TPA: hypothetical protein PLP19_11215 [bacterium]|nr:hypothetical protein [bacterium]HPN44051.1 hypothetical protein [bacterium]